MRKLLRILTALLAVIMTLSAVPFAHAAGEEAESFRIPTVQIKSDREPVFGDSCFAVGSVIYDEIGNEIATIPDDETVYTIGKNCVISMIVPDDIIDIEIGGDVDYELTYKVYEFDGKALKYVKTYESKNKLTLVLPYNMSSYLNENIGSAVATDMTDEYTLMYTTVIYLNVEIESDQPEYLGYEVLDSYGKTIYSDNGPKIGYHIGEGIIAEIHSDGYSTIISGLDSNITKAGVSGIIAGSAYNGLVPYIDADLGYYGICDVSGEIKAFPDFVSIERCEDYFIAHADPEVYGYYDAVVFDKTCDGVYELVGRVLTYYNGTVAVSYDDDGVTQMIFAESEEVIAESDIYYYDSGYHLFEYVTDDGEYVGDLYDAEGKLIIENVYEFSVDISDDTLVVMSADDMKYYRYDKDGNKLGAIETDAFAISAGANGIHVAYDASSEGMYLESELGRLTSIHSMCYSCAVGEISDVFVMADVDYDTFDIQYTVYVISDSPLPFTDVKEGNWAYASILAAYESGIMQGTGGLAFSPKSDVSRAQVVTILWRAAGEPEPEKQSGTFTDVESGKWYSKAVEWASEQGIVEGVGGGMFAPTRSITRAELAVMLYRYADVLGADMVEGADISNFPDADKVRSWGADGVKWCVAEGIINGKTAGAGNAAYLAPNDKLTRAEIAAVISRCDFLE